MRRRDFITLLAGTAAWPLKVHAQQAAVPVIGVLISQTLGPYADRLAAFHRGLKQGGFCRRRQSGGRVPLGGGS